ncbi:hypothetical protein EJ05DRAFT_479102 [Pseudovirgaria hyperparasitica]|uniref:Acyltransferase 3 domain-containing protein n=1 Tax=Pseudovirgaria hyperparasitica TaxID=470096 RepID=A0A6A6VY83_9PEZI|nr:uncharacterized protein EJ05DRAFT_479102 [Pseudovirgaria hyperparasitica]KAF2754664.1 hypothetical protein EJ05DRAFT_479102 [Pseudovirgaria hyperparasitica]
MAVAGLLQSLQPSFMSWRKASASPPLRKTAYLDGLRGFAAFLVYIMHHELWAHSATQTASIIEFGWGYDDKYALVSFPWIRQFFSGGHSAVACFYVISGYVLTYKPLQLILSGNVEKLADNVASAIFRRWLRLYLPIVGVSLVYVFTIHIFHLEGNGHHMFETYWEQLLDLYREFMAWSYAFQSKGFVILWLTYNPHTWSITYEMKGSLVIYMTALCTARFPRTRRWTLYAILIFYFMVLTDGWYIAIFVTGMWLAELDMHLEAGTLEPPPFLTENSTTLFYGLFISAIFLNGIPNGADNEMLGRSFGWGFLRHLHPPMEDPKWFYLLFSAPALVACIPRIWWLRSFFDSRFCQYLGRISYSLYLIHGYILSLFGARIYAAVGFCREGVDDKNFPWWCNRTPLPQWGIMGLELNFLVAQLILLPVTFWLSEIVTKLIDEPSVKFAQNTWRWFLEEDSKPDAKPASLPMSTLPP